jgi:DNA-binding CsgD family transcriptional regulator
MMSMVSGDRRVLPCFTGGLLLLCATMFSPLDAVLFPTSADTTVSAESIVVILVLFVSSLGILSCSLHLSRRRLLRAASILAVVCSVFGCALIPPLWQSLPLVGIGFLCVSAVLQLYLCAQFTRRIPISELGIGLSVTTAAAMAIELALVSFNATSYVAFLVIGISLIVCSCALVPMAGTFANQPATTEVASASGDSASEMPDRLAPVKAQNGFRLLRNDWRSLMGCAICALIFGSGVPSDVFPLDTASIAASYVGRFAGAIVSCAVFVQQLKHPMKNGTCWITLLAVAVGILVYPFSNQPVTAEISNVLPSASQTIFIILLFLETQLTGREARDSGALLIAGLAIFMLAWMLGFALGYVFSGGIVIVASHLLYILCLALLLVTYTQSGSIGAQPEKREKTYDSLVGDICNKMCEEFGLSPREAEVLPLLVMGLTSATIAERLVISPHTVKTYIRRIYFKTDTHSREELLTLFNKRAHTENG